MHGFRRNVELVKNGFHLWTRKPELGKFTAANCLELCVLPTATIGTQGSPGPLVVTVSVSRQPLAGGKVKLESKCWFRTFDFDDLAGFF